MTHNTNDFLTDNQNSNSNSNYKKNKKIKKNLLIFARARFLFISTHQLLEICRIRQNCCSWTGFLRAIRHILLKPWSRSELWPESVQTRDHLQYDWEIRDRSWIFWNCCDCTYINRRCRDLSKLHCVLLWGLMLAPPDTILHKRQQPEKYVKYKI